MAAPVIGKLLSILNSLSIESLDGFVKRVVIEHMEADQTKVHNFSKSHQFHSWAWFVLSVFGRVIVLLSIHSSGIAPWTIIFEAILFFLRKIVAIKNC
jgi:hypothetical protein